MCVHKAMSANARSAQSGLTSQGGPSEAIAISAPAGETEAPLGVRLIEEILTAHQGAVHVSSEGGVQSIGIELPAAARECEVSVLVVDDNEDLVSFFTSYTAGAAYRIQHAATGAEALSAVQERRPDVIVLDMMLPDAAIDGWGLLMQLHPHMKRMRNVDRKAAHHILIVTCIPTASRRHPAATGGYP